MKTELEQKLVQKYPKIFINYGKSPQESCMAFGFEHRDGWYLLIDMLCASIQFYLDQTPNIPQVHADQVKEKFGSLRFYFSGGDDYIDELVALTEFISSKICEICGKPGKINDTGWLTCLCEECLKKKK